jgi:hypothetical protein
MENLKTTYLGLKLRNPCCGLTKIIAGVLPLLFAMIVTYFNMRKSFRKV